MKFIHDDDVLAMLKVIHECGVQRAELVKAREALRSLDMTTEELTRFQDRVEGITLRLRARLGA